MKPILFNTEMVRAILDGRKTVTRRVIKPQHLRVLDSQYHKEHPEASDKVLLERLCEPPYRPGEILYVRETWAKGYIERSDSEGSCEQWFEENYEPPHGSYLDALTAYFYRAEFSRSEEKELNMIWRPSIHMPKEAARIFLRVTGVRVERLRNMGMEDALKEGIIPTNRPGGCRCRFAFEGCMEEPCPNRAAYEIERHMDPFMQLWDGTIKKADLGTYGWAADPWVWVIEFQRITKEEAEHD